MPDFSGLEPTPAPTTEGGGGDTREPTPSPSRKPSEPWATRHPSPQPTPCEPNADGACKPTPTPTPKPQEVQETKEPTPKPTKKPFGIIWIDKKCIKKCEDTFDGVCEDSRNCDDDSRCFDGSECSTLAGEECDDWAGGESTETRGRCNGELDDADEDNKEDS